MLQRYEIDVIFGPICSTSTTFVTTSYTILEFSCLNCLVWLASGVCQNLSVCLLTRCTIKQCVPGKRYLL